MFGKAGMGFGDLFGGLLQGGGGFGFNGGGMTVTLREALRYLENCLAPIYCYRVSVLEEIEID